MTTKQLTIEQVIYYVAIYLRKSRGDLETDLIKHLTIMKEICDKFNWKYVIYEEIGSGSTIENRPKMKELMRDLDEDMYDAVMVVDFDRLGRGDEEDQGIIKKHLLKNDTLVIECSPYRVLNLYDENDMQIVEFKGFLARQEYNMITKRLNRGKKIGAKLGHWSNGLSVFPYDYDANRKGLVINKDKYEVYRDMVDRLFRGESLNQIAEYLNSINYPSPRSKYKKQADSKWHGNSIGAILKSEVHLGKIISNKSKYNKYKKERIEIPKNEWVVVENCHEKCKTEEEHEKIISIIQGNRKKMTNFKQVNMYTSLVKCYHCESTLHIQKRKNGKYSVRKCKCGIQGGDCDFLIDVIKDMLIEINENVVQIADKLNRNSDKNIIENKMQKIENKINGLSDQKRRITEGYIHELYSIEEAKSLSKPIEANIEQLSSELEQLNKELTSVSTINPNELKNKMSNAISTINNADEQKVNGILKKVIDVVLWERNGDDLNVYVELKRT